METKPVNPPAFPVDSGAKQFPYQEGMTLRDYFAAAALQGILSKYSMSDLTEVSVAVLGKNDPTVFASAVSFEFAQAMLVERQKHL